MRSSSRLVGTTKLFSNHPCHTPHSPLIINMRYDQEGKDTGAAGPEAIPPRVLHSRILRDIILLLLLKACKISPGVTSSS
jgi:hypothetical protein